MGRVIMARLEDHAPTPIDDQNINQVWKAQVRTDEGEVVVAYIKRVEEEELVKEAVCALIARAVGLPCPRPMYVLCPAGTLMDTQVIAFGSEDAEARSLRRRIGSGAPETVLKILTQWVKVNDVAAFDEWIANGDRNVGNILFDGSKFTLIDHGQAFDSGTPANQVADVVKALGADVALQKMFKASSLMEAKAATITTDKLHDILAKAKATDTFAQPVATLLNDRSSRIEELLRERYGRRLLI